MNEELRREIDQLRQHSGYHDHRAQGEPLPEPSNVVNSNGKRRMTGSQRYCGPHVVLCDTFLPSAD